MIMKFKGFTLIEILVVFSLIGIIIGLSVTAYTNTRKTARDGKRKADLEQIRSALEIYRTDVGFYPTTLNFGAPFFYEDDVYMSIVPNDPLFPTFTYVYSRLNPNSYKICAYLETGTGDVGCGNCGAQPCNYKVTNP